VDLVSPRGERTVPVAEFFVADGIANTVRAPDELVTRIRLPLPQRGTRSGFRKLRPRGSIDFPVLNMAVALGLEPDGRLREVRLVVSALGSRPREVTGLEELAGDRLDNDIVEAIARRAHEQCRPLTNIIVDPEWRRAMVPVHARRLLRDVERPGAGAARPG
jgi:4-hydroxybenzoyl-CoA reductase subunit beta